MSNRDDLMAKIEAQASASDNEFPEIVVGLDDFFEGNDDLGSIGCNLGEQQPTIAEFYRVLSEIRSNPEVQDVLVRIYDYSDPDSWPFTDTVYILTSAPVEQVKQWVAPLLPDEVNTDWMYGKPATAPDVQSGITPYSVWWD